MGRSHGLEFTLNTVPGFHTLGSTRCGFFFLGPDGCWPSKVKGRTVCFPPVPRHPLQFIRVHAKPPPGSGLCSGGDRGDGKGMSGTETGPG